MTLTAEAATAQTPLGSLRGRHHGRDRGHRAQGGGTSGDVTLAANPAAVQTRVTGAGGPGSSIRTVNQDGSVVCEPDDDSPGWGLFGNVGTNPATNFMGTTDNQAFEVRVAGARALRLESFQVACP